MFTGVPATTVACPSPVNNTETIVIAECNDEYSTQSIPSSRASSLEEIGERVNGDVKKQSGDDDVMEVFERNSRSRYVLNYAFFFCIFDKC